MSLTDQSNLRGHYDDIPALCLVVDSTFRIRTLNRFGLTQLGYTLKEVVSQKVSMLCVPPDSDFFLEKLTECLARPEDSSIRFEVMQRRKDGSQYWARHTVHRLGNNAEHSDIFILCEDITETRYLIHELEQQNALDSLTGLYSRRRFDRELEQLIISTKTRSTKHCLCFIDLDEFKVVNDSGGHQAGDELLRNISIVLKSLVRAEDILARLGGDEFGLILNNCTLKEAEVICDKILATLSKHRFKWKEDVFTIGASIGVLVIDNSSGSAGELLRQVDSACYVAKDRGRNCVHVFSPTDAETERRSQLMRWLSRLNWAFDHNSFELHAQKILPIQPQQAHLTYYEFLVRMIDNNGELVSPAEFIPAAEYYGLAGKMDRWVTRQALTLATQMQQNEVNTAADQHKKIYFINLSGLTLGDKKFVEDISELLIHYSARNFGICFEITETAAIQNMSAAIKFMQHFRTLGCMFALDDFGSGFSSFTYLRELPIDFIKIDGAFVKSIMAGPSELAIVKAIHEIAKAFGMKTIAEHIETSDVLEQLVALGVDFAQGYYLHRPSPVNAGQIQ